MKIDLHEYQSRRQALCRSIGANGVLIVPSATEKVRNRDCFYPFRQDSDFWYLTGFHEPEALLVLAPGRQQGETILFCRANDRSREVWDGARTGPDAAVDQYAVDQAFAITELDTVMPGLLNGRKTLFHTANRNRHLDQMVWGWIEALKQKEKSGAVAPGQISDREGLIHTARMYKSAAEQNMMRKAATISMDAHRRAMQVCQPGMAEYQLEAALLHEFAEQGARFPAYSSIVAGGANSCTLHYCENSATLQDGDLVLIDAGCEYGHYASDITRTFPVNGRFTGEQKALYEVVLKAQLAAIEQVAPKVPFDAFHKAALTTLVEGLIDLGLLAGDPHTLIEEKKFMPFFMHGTGHWLGLDVHDVGHHREQDKPILLQPGMALTVEPGLYIATDNTEVEERWRGLGIRIEDDLLVTESGCDVITANLAKTVQDIEALMAS